MTSYIAHATDWTGKPGSRRGLLLVLLGFAFSLTAFGAADALIHLTSSATGFVLAGMAAMLVLRALPARLPRHGANAGSDVRQGGPGNPAGELRRSPRT